MPKRVWLPSGMKIVSEVGEAELRSCEWEGE